MATSEADVRPMSKLLFSQVYFHVIPSPGWKGKEAEILTQLLETNGAIQPFQSPGSDSFAVERVTHLISTTSDFPEYEAAVTLLKAVVKPSWVNASILKGRLANPRHYSPDPRLFFSGLVVTCADLPTGDKDAIIGGVLAMGGLHASSVSKMVTHIVALTTDPEKCQTAINKNLTCKIVLPHWFDDCLKLGKRIDESPYCLPDPEILRKRPEDRIPEAGRPDLEGASSAQPGRLPTPSLSPDKRRRQLTVFNSKKVMLSSDLEIGSHLRGTIEDLITDGGGSVTGSVHKANIFVCQYRDTLEYRIASRAGSDVGNLPWLYHLITHNAWTSPLRRLLHYPIARHGLPGFKDFRISLSNYNGEARVYLENVAKAAGGEFTKTMKEDNTHLITAHMVSEKCDAAKEWNINMVNHLWLEESYAKWEIQTLTNPRYTHFPSCTNLGEVVGQTPIDKQAIERHFFRKGSDIEPSAKSETVENPVEQNSLNTTSSRLQSKNGIKQSGSTKVEDPVPYRTVKHDASTPKASKANKRHNDDSSLKTPANLRHVAEGKENETPPTTGSRSAKARAVEKLHDLAPDIALYEKESKRVGGVIFGGRRSSDDLRSDIGRKRSMSKENDTGTEADEEIRGAKRVKKSKTPVAMRLLLTGYKKWIGIPKKENEERIRLRELGILITQDTANCTHLASPQIVRTQKFICAFAHAPIVLSTDFVDECLAENKRLPPENYKLNDIEGEKRLGYKLSDSTKRAKENKGHLLKNYTIYCTEAIHGGFDTYKSIIESNGGKCLPFRVRASSIASTRGGGLDGNEDGEAPILPEYLYLLSGVSHEEIRLWTKFRQIAHGERMIPRIVKTDWIIDLALSQRIVWNESHELTDKDFKADE